MRGDMMGCDTNNMSFTDKVKLIAEKMANGVFAFVPANWSKNLKSKPETLQGVLDIVDQLDLKEYELSDEDRAILDKVDFDSSGFRKNFLPTDDLQRILDKMDKFDIVFTQEQVDNAMTKVGRLQTEGPVTLTEDTTEFTLAGKEIESVSIIGGGEVELLSGHLTERVTFETIRSGFEIIVKYYN
jgi:hypothetical protein